MIKKKIALAMHVFAVFFAFIFCHKLAYSQDDYSSYFVLGLFQQSSVMNINQSMVRGQQKKCNYAIHPISFGANIGYKFKSKTIAEAEGLLGIGNNISPYYAVLANLLYEQNINHFFSAYFGAGAGVSGTSSKSGKANFASQFKFGVNMTKISKKLVPNFGYRFLRMSGSDVSFTGKPLGDLKVHNLQLGILMYT